MTHVNILLVTSKISKEIDVFLLKLVAHGPTLLGCVSFVQLGDFKISLCNSQVVQWVKSNVVIAAASCHCCGMGSIPGLGTFTCQGSAKKKKNQSGTQVSTSLCFHHALLPGTRNIIVYATHQVLRGICICTPITSQHLHSIA